MQKIFIKIVLCFILICLLPLKIFSQSGWNVIPSGTNKQLSSIQFISEDIGFCSGDSGIFLKTVDGGNTWQSINTGLNKPFYQIHFFNENEGLFITLGQIYKTINGGNSLILVSPESPQVINVVPRVNFQNNNGYAALNNSTEILKTTNFGTNWNLLNISSPNCNIIQVAINSSNIGYGIGRAPNYVLKSVTNGNTWSQISYPLNTLAILDLQVLDINNVYFTVGDKFMRTTNGGSNWITSEILNKPNFNSLFFLNLSTGYLISSSGIIVKTTNFGNTFELQRSNFPDNYWGIYFNNINTGFVCGSNGIILKTTNGGTTHIETISAIIPEKFTLIQNYPNPFNPTTKIKFDIPVNTNIKLKILDVLGKEVEVLLNQFINKGSYEIDWVASKYSSGLYYCIFQVYNSNNSLTYFSAKKMVLLK